MAMKPDSRITDVPFGLGLFLSAQETDYEQALAEIRAGQKPSRRMWYMSPQVEGLGFQS